MKLKLSSMLLLGIFILIIGGLFTSGFMLKKQYDTINKKDGFWYYNQIASTPFKHIKIERNSRKKAEDDFYKSVSVTGKITFEVEAGDTYKVVSNPNRNRYIWDSYQEDTLSAKLIDDTLFIKVPMYSNYYDNNRHITYDIRITMPYLASITCVNTSLELIGYNKKSLTIDLSGESVLTFLYGINEMTAINATLKDESKLELPKMLKLNNLGVDLKDKSTLKMPIIGVKSLKLSVEDSTSIEAPSTLFKKGIEK